MWPAKQTSGRASPRRAHRLVTPLQTSVSQRKPSGASRSREQRLAAGVVRRERAPRDQFARQRERRHGGGVHAADGSKCRGLPARWTSDAPQRGDAIDVLVRAVEQLGVDRHRREVRAGAPLLASSGRASIASTRDDGLFWLICQARLVGESEAIIASS